MIEIVLEVNVVVANATEPGIVTACFTTELSQPLNRDAMFEIALSNSTTSTVEFDFLPEFDSHFLVIPSNFSGVYEVCADVIVFDDVEVERDEIIVYDVTPLSELDTVEFPGNYDSIIFTIIDDDSKYIPYIPLEPVDQL